MKREELVAYTGKQLEDKLPKILQDKQETDRKEAEAQTGVTKTARTKKASN